VHVFCLSCNVKKSTTNVKLSENIRNKLMLLSFLTICCLPESGTRKALFWSVTINNKHVSTAQIEPVQDKYILSVSITGTSSWLKYDTGMTLELVKVV
jgi:hypothetical protein